MSAAVMPIINALSKKTRLRVREDLVLEVVSTVKCLQWMDAADKAEAVDWLESLGDAINVIDGANDR